MSKQTALTQFVWDADGKNVKYVGVDFGRKQ